MVDTYIHVISIYLYRGVFVSSNIPWIFVLFGLPCPNHERKKNLMQDLISDFSLLAVEVMWDIEIKYRK